MPAKRSPDLDLGSSALGTYRYWRRRNGLDVEVTNPDVAPYRLQMRLVRTGGWHVQTFTIEQLPGGVEINAVGLREVKFGLAVASAFGLWNDYTEEDDEDAPSLRQQQALDSHTLMVEAVRAYRRALDRGSRSPTKDAAEELGWSRSHIGRLLVRARRERPDLLGPAPAGKAGEQ